MAALVVAIISALVSSGVSRRTSYINAVTVERSKWLEAMRGTISKYSAAAATLGQKRKTLGYEESPEWIVDSERLQILLTELTLRLNPTELEARNLLFVAKRLDQAARLHASAAVYYANEVMIRHAQWVLKFEWERVKREASGPFRSQTMRWRQYCLERSYRAFLCKDGSLEGVAQIGAGLNDAVFIRLRSQMDS